jgi:PAS domain S-box-containing protein
MQTPNPDPAAALPAEETQRLLHALRVHQIELETQNEELRRTQLALDAARARYFDLYDMAPVGYCTVSADDRILETNFTAATQLGLTRSALVGKPVTQFIVTAHQDIYYQCRKQVFASGEPQTCELQMSGHDGARLWIHLTTTVVHDDAGQPVLRMVLNDITEARTLAAAVETSEARYRALVEWSPEAIGVHRDGKIIYANAAAVKMFGAASAQELVGTPIMDRAHPDFHALIQARLDAMTDENGATPVIEEVLLRLDGTAFDAEVQSILTMFDGVPATQAAVRDVSERKRLNQALQQKNIELERARQEADRANHAKSEFLSSMSHELRSPLNAILGFAQLMESASPPPTPVQAGRINHILQAGWYLLELINEILDLSLIESGRLSMTLEPVSVAEKLRECQNMVASQAQARGIQVEFVPPDTPWRVRADPTRLQQILVNLLSNAIKYNRAGGSVHVICSAPGADRLRISVQDTGEGLSPAKLAGLFQPFNRLGQEAGSVEGTGIGLVVSRRLAELMDGEIGVQSTVGVGSVFWVELHLADTGAAGTAARDSSMLHPAPPPLPRTALRTVLCIEDNPANLQLVEQLVALRPGLRLLSSGDAMGGITLARTHHPDVILMDMNLPGINGMQALKILKEDPATQAIPVVALSANAMPHDIGQGLAAGFLDYLTKPIRTSDFMDVLDSALEFAQTQALRSASGHRPA